MKKVSVRPVDDPLLEEGIGRLRAIAFPHVPEARDPESYSRVYRWFESHPLADEVHRWAAVTAGGEVVGHLSAFPQYYRIVGHRVVAHTPGDYMVHPDHGFQALSLMRAFFRAAENCVACDVAPAVVGVERRFGAEPAGQLTYAAKLLNVSRLPVPPVPARLAKLLDGPGRSAPARGYPERHPGADRTEVSPDLQKQDVPATRPRLALPAPVRGLLNGGLRAADEALGRAFPDGPRTEVLDGFDTAFDGLFEEVAAAVPCVAEKDAAFLRWRYGPGSPQAPVTVLGARDGRRLLGYAVLKVTEGMDGYVLDLTALPGRPDVARALILASVRSLRGAGADVVRYRHGGPLTSPSPGDLMRLGFFFRNRRRNTLLAKFADPALQGLARHIPNWSYNIGDGEPTFWMR